MLSRSAWGTTLLLFMLGPQSEAHACGGFFPARENARKPSLSHEQVLLVYDAAHQREHFVREVTFRGDGKTFGFVVPHQRGPRWKR